MPGANAALLAFILPLAEIVVCSAVLRGTWSLQRGDAANLAAVTSADASADAAPVTRLAFTPALEVEQSSLPTSRSSKEEEPVHLCSVVFGNKAVKELDMFLASLDAHRGSSRFVVHILTDGSTRELARNLVSKWRFTPDVRLFDFSHYQDKLREMRIGFNNQYAFIGHVKPFLFERFSNVDRCIVHDSDMHLMEPPAALWQLFRNQSDETLMTAVWHGENWFGDKLNSGMMLQDFARMRRRNFTDALRSAYKYAAMAIEAKVLGPGNKVDQNGSIQTVWGDQAVYHWALMAYENLTNASAKPTALNALSPSWNLQMCQKFDGYCEGRKPAAASFLGALHMNCHWSQGTWWESEVFQKKYRECFAGKLNSAALRLVPHPYINLHNVFTKWKTHPL